MIMLGSIANAALHYSATCGAITGKSVWIGHQSNEDEWHSDGFAGEQWTFEWEPGESRAQVVSHGAKGGDNVEGLILLWADTEHATMLSFSPQATWLYTIFLRAGRLMASAHKVSAELMGFAPSKEEAIKMGIDRKPFEQQRSYAVFGTCTITAQTN
jgi:hypothetical protein